MIWEELYFKHFRKGISPYYEILGGKNSLTLQGFQNFGVDYRKYINEEENKNVVKESSVDPWVLVFEL